MQKWIDTHSHYDHKKINHLVLINKMFDTNEKIITLGTEIRSNIETLRLINYHKDMYGMIGFFPNDAYVLESDFVGKNTADKNLETYLSQLENDKIVGIGEIGLDLHHNNFGKKEYEIKGPKAIDYQKKYLEMQLLLAKDLNMPVSLHSRDAIKETREIFDKFDSIKGVMHCFSYDTKEASYYLDKGLYIGVGGTITYKSNDVLRNAIKEVPLDRILLETDAPFLTPVPFRGKINNSGFIEFVILALAEIKDVDPEEIIKITNQNAYELFKFGAK